MKCGIVRTAVEAIKCDINVNFIFEQPNAKSIWLSLLEQLKQTCLCSHACFAQ